MMSFGYLKYLKDVVDSVRSDVALMSYVQLINNLEAFKDMIAWDADWQNDTVPFSGSVQLVPSTPGIVISEGDYVVLICVEGPGLEEDDYVRIVFTGPGINPFILHEDLGITLTKRRFVDGVIVLDTSVHVNIRVRVKVWRV